MRFKKIILTILLTVFTISLAGCEFPGGGGGTNVDPSEKYFYRIDVTTEKHQYEKVELALYEKELKIASLGNPYDYNYLKVMAEITAPSGKVINMPAFWYQDYSLVFNTMSSTQPQGISGVASTSKDEPQGLETIGPIGDPHYRVRFTPTEVGTYKIVFKIYKNGVLTSTENEMDLDITASNAIYKGVLEVDQTTKRNFCFSETKETFVTVGQNACWYTSSTRKEYDYKVWFKQMADNNMNTTRIWLAPWGFSMHSGTKYNDFSSRYAALARLDLTIEEAVSNNIYMMLCLINHGQFSTNVNPTWDTNPYNSANGGIIDHPQEFFTSEEAKEAYKNELMYIIARYGYCSNILCWELFNEVDWCDSYSMLSTWYRTWHSDMATFLKENDPYHHMVSTSYRGNEGNAYFLSNIDFVSPHDYSYTNKNWISNIESTQNTLFDRYQKPVFFGEIGMNGENGITNYNLDKAGISLHQAQWAGMMSGGAGGAMNWWWDSYVHPYNLYHNFYGAGAFSKLMDLSGSDYTLLKGIGSVSNSNLNMMGYKFDDRIYGYIYDKAWTYYNTNIVNKNNVVINIPFNNGTYTLSLYDTNTGEVINSYNINIINGVLGVTIPEVQYDIAFIVK